MKRITTWLLVGFATCLVGALVIIESTATADAAARRGGSGFSRPAPSRSVSRPAANRSFNRSAAPRQNFRTNRSVGTNRSFNQNRSAVNRSNLNRSAHTNRTSRTGLNQNQNRSNRTGLNQNRNTLAATHHGNQRMINKPNHVMHNPHHMGGNLGHHFNHQPHAVFHNGHFWQRSWYYGLVGGALSWYWWDAPLAADDPGLLGLAEIPSCVDTDDCPMLPMAAVRTRLVAAPFVAPLGPAVPVATPVAAPVCTPRVGANTVACTLIGSPAGAGSCHLFYDLNDGQGPQDFGASPPGEMPVAPNREYTNICQWLAD